MTRTETNSSLSPSVQLRAAFSHTRIWYRFMGEAAGSPRYLFQIQDDECNLVSVHGYVDIQGIICTEGLISHPAMLVIATEQFTWNKNGTFEKGNGIRFVIQ